MGWIINENCTRVFRIKFRENRNLHTLDFLTKEQAKSFLEFEINQLQSNQARLAAENQVEENLDLRSHLVNQFVEESHICKGMVRKKGVFQLVNRLNNPLTNEEKAHIRRVKFNAKPQSFQELQSKVTSVQN
jgi:hypothetical protein